MTFTASKKLFCIRSNCAIDGVPRVPNFSAKNTWSPPHRPLGTRRLTDGTVSSAVIKCKSRKKNRFMRWLLSPKTANSWTHSPKCQTPTFGKYSHPRMESLGWANIIRRSESVSEDCKNCNGKIHLLIFLLPLFFIAPTLYTEKLLDFCAFGGFVLRTAKLSNCA